MRFDPIYFCRLLYFQWCRPRDGIRFIFFGDPMRCDLFFWSCRSDPMRYFSKICTQTMDPHMLPMAMFGDFSEHRLVHAYLRSTFIFPGFAGSALVIFLLLYISKLWVCFSPNLTLGLLPGVPERSTISDSDQVSSNFEQYAYFRPVFNQQIDPKKFRN